MSRKRVLYVIDSLRRFGATRQLDLLTKILATEFDVHVAVLDLANTAPAILVPEDDPRTFHFLASEEPVSTLRSLSKSGLRLRKLIQRLEPDVLHAWCQRAERVALLAAIEFKSLKRFATELYLRPPSRMVSKAIDGRLAGTLEKVVASHDEVKKSLLEDGYPEQKIAIIANGFESHEINRTDARRKLIDRCRYGEDVYLFGAVAELEPPSRLKDLIWATDLLTCIRDDVHFFIFGSGSQRERLQRFAYQTEAGDHVHFVENECDALELIPGLDAFWHSHLNEPLPSVMCHAMSSEVPVISVYGSGTSELIDHQESAFATNLGARDEFARWSKFLLEKPDQSQQLAEQGRQAIGSKYPAGQMVAAYRELYAGA